MHPQCRISVDGKDVSGAFMERLMSCEVTDKVGSSSDTVSIELDDFPPAAIPRKGAIIRVWMGYKETGLAFLGAFTADQIKVSMFPHTMSISGKGTDLRDKMKEPKDRAWENKTLGDIVGEIASDHGLKAKIDKALGAFDFPWIGQAGESDLEFVERLADRHNALFAIKDGNMVFADRGAGKKPDGTALPTVTVTPEILIVGTAKVTFADRSKVDKVRAKYHDRDKAKTFEIGEPA